MTEEKFLHQIHLEEQFGPASVHGQPRQAGGIADEEAHKKKLLAPKKAAIGFTYEDSTAPAAATTGSAATGSASTNSSVLGSAVVPLEALASAADDDESDSDVDLGTPTFSPLSI